MRIPPLLLATLVVGLFQPCKAATRDHLVPQYEPKWKSYSDYRDLLRKKLGSAPYDCGRILALPDLGPEALLSVSSNIGRARVTLLTPSKNIWQSKQSHEHVKIIQIKRDLPNETAGRFRKGCERLLGDIRPLAPLKSNAAVRLVHDLPLFEIALQRMNRPPLSGDVPYPYPGKKTEAVESLFQSLEAYCEGKKPGRTELLVRIERQIAIVLDEKN